MAITNTKVTVTTSSTEVLAAKAAPAFVIITNPSGSSGSVWLHLGDRNQSVTATTTNGLELQTGAQITLKNFSGSVTGIVASGTVDLALSYG